VAVFDSLIAIENKESRRKNVARKARNQQKRNFIQQGAIDSMRGYN